MKKGLISIVLVAAMLTVMSCGVFADGFSKLGKELADKYGNGNLVERTVNVETDIKVAKNGSSDYSDTSVVYKTSTSANASFDFKTTLYMAEVGNAFNRFITNAENDKTLSKDEFDKQMVKGEFEIKITYPAVLAVPDYFLNPTENMAGFNDEAKQIFKETSRTVTDDGSNKVLTIKVAVKNPEDATKDYVTKAQLSSGNYFSDMTLTCEGVETTELSTTSGYRIKGEITGSTTIFNEADDGTTGNTGIIKYKGIQEGTKATPKPIDDAIVYIYKRTYGGGSGGGSNGDESIPKTKVVIMFDVNSDTTLINGMEVDRNSTINLDEITKPTKAGYIFDGFYEDRLFTKKLSGEYKVTKDTVLYSRWIEEETPSVFSDEHLAYIAGYPDGTIKPLNNISREEVATILYRLLKTDVRTKIYSTTNSFTDVDSTRWSNEAVSTMANGGYIMGYEDGSFRPENNITRAEFVTIIARFTEVGLGEGDYYKDIYNHWAKSYIQTAADKGWLEGYADGTFRPDEYITRADVIKIMNNMLNRHVDANGLTENATQWSDNPEGASYYYDILEATNSHNFERSAGEAIEKWTELVSKTLIVDKTLAE